MGQGRGGSAMSTTQDEGGHVLPFETAAEADGWHYSQGQLILCLECHCAPCDEECRSQTFPPVRKRAWAAPLVAGAARIARETREREGAKEQDG